MSFNLKNKITQRDKIAFLSAIIAFFVIHLFKISNYLPNHDALTSFYSAQNIIGSGRWFLSVACLPSTYFDLPWVIGVLCAIYIALTSVIVVRIFDFESAFSVLITSALLVSFPAVTETMLFGFTADGYFLAQLLAAVSVKLVTTVNQKWYMYIGAGILLCLCCGIYQAYFSFAAVLVLVYILLEIIKKNKTTKEILAFGGKQIALFGAALVVYYVVWKIMIALQGAAINDYQDISEAQNVAFSIRSVISSGIKMVRSLISFVFGSNVLKGKITFYSIVGAVLLALIAFIICRVVIKKKLWQKKSLLLIFVVALIMIPLCAYFWQFASVNTAYGTRMLSSLALLYLVPLALSEKYLAKIWKKLIVGTLCLLIGLFALQANIAYLFIHQCYESTYHTTSEILQRVHITAETGEEKIVIVGNFVQDTEIRNHPLSTELGSLTGTLKSTLAYKHDNISAFTKNTFFNETDFASHSEIAEVEQNPAIADMPCWPAKESVKLLDGYIVVKLSEVQYTAEN